MNIRIKTTNFPLTPSIQEYVDKKFEPLSIFLGDESEVAICDVEVGRTTNHHKSGDIYRAEIHITARDTNIYASSQKEDLYSAIDTVKDEAYSKLKTSKDKKVSKVKRGGAKIKNIIKGIFKD